MKNGRNKKRNSNEQYQYVIAENENMKKIIVVVLGLIIASVIIVITMGNIFHLFPALNSISSPTPSNTLPSTPEIPTTPSGNNTQAPPSATITFDFDHGIPVLFEGQNIPLSQKSGGLTASISSPSDPTAFSIQSYDTTFYTLSQFSGNYLWDNKAEKNIVEITFSQMITRISLTFATVEYHGVGNVDEPSIMQLHAYQNSTQRSLIGSSTAQGVFSSDMYPQGTLSFTSPGKAFNQVTIELANQTGPTTEFFIDNIIVQIAP